MPFQNLFLVAGGVVVVLMFLLWLLSLALKNASIVDIFWGIGFVIVTWLAFTLAPQGYLPRKQLIPPRHDLGTASPPYRLPQWASRKISVTQNGGKTAHAGGESRYFKYFYCKAF
jgi:hypothetical protein